jgi:calcineurin-like phosphoesterase family protein
MRTLMAIGRTIAVGDIHGCSLALRVLLAAIGPRREDLFIPLGDYVDHGPDSRGVIDQLLALTQRCRVVPLLGNHEQLLLGVLGGRSPFRWLECGGKATLDSYGFVGGLRMFPADHLAFLHHCRKYYETETHFFVHAGYRADLPLDRQTTRALLWEFLNEHHPPAAHCSGKVGVVGHTPQGNGELLDLGFLKCLDTGCHQGGWLTALDVESGQVWQADEGGRCREREMVQAVVRPVRPYSMSPGISS